MEQTTKKITLQDIQENEQVKVLIERADQYLDAIGYTNHGYKHVNVVAERAEQIIRGLELPEREAELAAIAAYLHDVGNVVHRDGHPITSATISFVLLKEMGMPIEEITMIIGAIGNHDENNGDPVSNIAAALIIADKSDVHRGRVRNPKMISLDIHDRVNYAAEKSELIVDKDNHLITLSLKVDTNISQVMEYFEIFMSRMAISRRSANFLNCDFRLVINDIQLM